MTGMSGILCRDSVPKLPECSCVCSSGTLQWYLSQGQSQGTNHLQQDYSKSDCLSYPACTHACMYAGGGVILVPCANIHMDDSKQSNKNETGGSFLSSHAPAASASGRGVTSARLLTYTWTIQSNQTRTTQRDRQNKNEQPKKIKRHKREHNT